MDKRRLLVWVSLVLLFSVPLPALGQANSQGRAAQIASDPELLRQLEQLNKNQDDLRTRAERAEAQVAELRTRLDSASTFMTWGGGFIGVVVSFVTIVSFIGFWKAENRATQAHSFALSSAREAEQRAQTSFQFALSSSRDAEQRAQAGFRLAMDGEAAAQRRADEVHDSFLAGSKATLELVNETLNLAKDAMERAAKSIESRALVVLAELDSDAKTLLDSVSEQDDRGLVSDPDKTASLRSLAQRIEGFQHFKLVLPDSIQLPPECLFIRGMDFHLKQQFKDAFAAWRQVAQRDGVSPTLRSRAWYWIGYEQNNLTQFSEATVSFEQALSYAKGPRQLELRRLLVESRFFNREQEQPLIDSLNALLATAANSTDDGIVPVRTRISCTLGNIHISLGNDARLKGDHMRAREQYELAKQTLRDSRGDKWALFGFAEALYWLGEPEAVEIFRKQCRKMAQAEEVRRIEPRTKVLAKTTELICCLRTPEFHHEVDGIHNQLNEALGRVEGHLTVYSQLQRRNVTKSEFEVDIARLMTERNSPAPLPAST